MKKHNFFIVSPFVLLIVASAFVLGLNCSQTSPKDLSKKNDNISLASKDTVIISKDLLLGKMNYLTDTSFIEVEVPYANRKGQYMKKEAYAAYKKMYDAALKDGVTLTIISALRSYVQQKSIWENKWTGKVKVDGVNLSVSVPNTEERAKTILKYSSMPGTSRHHWGTDVDINSLTLVYFQSPAGKKMYDWMCNNALKFGFCQPYTAGRSSGYEEEKWHWSYLPLAKKYLSAYKKQISINDLNGFLGSESAKNLDVIDRYVMVVNKDCQ